MSNVIYYSKNCEVSKQLLTIVSNNLHVLKFYNIDLISVDNKNDEYKFITCTPSVVITGVNGSKKIFSNKFAISWLNSFIDSINRDIEEHKEFVNSPKIDKTNFINLNQYNLLVNMENNQTISNNH